jgi:hypothetical protein
VLVVFDPETNTAKWVESQDGKRIGDVVLLDKVHNAHRKRQRPVQEPMMMHASSSVSNPIELAYAQQQASLIINQTQEK